MSLQVVLQPDPNGVGDPGGTIAVHDIAGPEADELYGSGVGGEGLLDEFAVVRGEFGEERLERGNAELMPRDEGIEFGALEENATESVFPPMVPP